MSTFFTAPIMLADLPDEKDVQPGVLDQEKPLTPDGMGKLKLSAEQRVLEHAYNAKRITLVNRYPQHHILLVAELDGSRPAVFGAFSACEDVPADWFQFLHEQKDICHAIRQPGGLNVV